MTKKELLLADRAGLLLDYHNVPLGACQIPLMKKGCVWLLVVWSKVGAPPPFVILWARSLVLSWLKELSPSDRRSETFT
jgi:hypothetical protein